MNIKTKTIGAVIAAALLLLSSCKTSQQPDAFVRVQDGHFVLNGEKVSFIGANFWYGAILGSEGVGGDRQRLAMELDTLKSMGVNNLRVLVGGDGPDGIPTRISPTLQKEPGVYNDTIFNGLDYLLAEMAKRDMKAVLYINNSWEWSGGYGVYLEWAGAGKALIPAVDGYGPFMEQMAGFATNEKAHELFYQHLRNIVGRTNSITGKPYKDDPTIFSWQIANEPRCFTNDSTAQQAFVDWIAEAAWTIKQMDPNHMVSTGSEGIWGCEGSVDLYEKVHACKDIDYLTMHIWPYNWSWVEQAHPQEKIGVAVDSTNAYIDRNLAVSEKLNKPMVIEEFGFPRDDFHFEKTWGTWGRDTYYRQVANRVIDSDEHGGYLAGLNFWGWGGYAEQPEGHSDWHPGDDYSGDPAQEAQGLNSVYVSDVSTIEVIKDAAKHVAADYSATPVLENDWMFTVKDQKPLRVAVAAKHGKPVDPIVKVILTTDKHEPVTTFTQKAKLRKGIDTLSFNLDLKPGFYIADVQIADGISEKKFNIGCDPDDIVSPQDKQPDFDEFWAKAKADLDKVAPNFKKTLVPEKSNDMRNTYIVEYNSLGGAKIKGILVEPVKEGKYPVAVTFNGYGADPWWHDPSETDSRIDFTISTREQGVSVTPTTVKDWIRRGLKSPDTYYYRGAYMDCVRAMEFVKTLPNADLSRVTAEGASQGGALTLVTAALMPDMFQSIIAMVPFMSDFPDYFKVADWPANEVLPQAEKEGIADEDLYKTLSYFDVKNFADKITCPVFMLFGLQDETCPPHTNFGGYNMIKSEKQWKCYPLSGHGIHLMEPDLSVQKNAFSQKYDK